MTTEQQKPGQTKYQIVRFYKSANKANAIIKRNLTLGEAKTHCNDPATQTASYFDGFEKQPNDPALDRE